MAPLLDSIEEVLEALRKAGVDAFPAYGTLLGAVRGGKLIGHDSDADLGYVSDHTHPVDVVRESFGLQRRLAEMGYQISRYSGAAFKVDVDRGATARSAGLDVFGGFLHDGNLILMGEIRTPFEREWIFPLGTTTLEGRTLPAPADTDRFLTATYGPALAGARPGVPLRDPALDPPPAQRLVPRHPGEPRGVGPHLVQAAERQRAPSSGRTQLRRAGCAASEPDLGQVVDVGCGRGTDAATGSPATGCRPSGSTTRPAGADRLAAQAAEAGAAGRVPLLQPARAAPGARLGCPARPAGPGPRTGGAGPARRRRHRQRPAGRHLWRFAQMTLRGGGRLYLEFLVPARRRQAERFARQHFLHAAHPRAA